ncbi:ATP-dependent endonuclease [Serinicoccus kebangsaanensis]|uniref:ATP-dependent endonuclease n=1 Tax=Serinicoccus kebangsaanensis TaxID=2602069 RepID=UPI00124D41C2|nr:ATP-dependent endonuclease [Serinicoccus kebangsaanensis]
MQAGQRVLLVEGRSDAAALRAAAVTTGTDLSGTTILVLDGATNVARAAATIPSSAPVGALVDVAEQPMVRRRLTETGRPEAPLFVCVDDLEDELIRALGAEQALAVVTQEEDLRAFRSLQHQAAWRDEPVERQLRRFLGSGSGRKSRYAASLAAATPVDRTAGPLLAALRWSVSGP